MSEEVKVGMHHSKRNAFPNKISVLTLLPALLLVGCGSQEIDMVKGGRLPNCEGGTMAQVTDGFMKAPSWESGKTSDGREFVNVTGEISYMEKPVKATVQFFLDKSNKSFQFGALEFNGVPQAQLIAGVLLTKMCEAKASSGPQKTATQSSQAEDGALAAAKRDFEIKSSFAELAKATDRVQLAYKMYVLDNGVGVLPIENDWASLGLNAPVPTKEVSAISITKNGVITAMVAPKIIGDSSCGEVTYTPTVAADAILWHVETTCPEPAKSIVAKWNS